MKYKNPEEVLIEKLNSENENERIMALLNLVMNGNDYEKAMEYSLKFARENSEWIKGCGIECFGHIARIHKKLDLISVKEILKKSMKSESKIVTEKAESTIDDISHFMMISKLTLK